MEILEQGNISIIVSICLFEQKNKAWVMLKCILSNKIAKTAETDTHKT